MGKPVWYSCVLTASCGPGQTWISIRWKWWTSARDPWVSVKIASLVMVSTTVDKTWTQSTQGTDFPWTSGSLVSLNWNQQTAPVCSRTVCSLGFFRQVGQLVIVAMSEDGKFENPSACADSGAPFQDMDHGPTWQHNKPKPTGNHCGYRGFLYSHKYRA